MFKIFKIQNDEVHVGLNSLAALKLKKTEYVIHLITTLQKAYSF
jgi:hypothetical protein